MSEKNIFLRPSVAASAVCVAAGLLNAAYAQDGAGGTQSDAQASAKSLPVPTNVQQGQPSNVPTVVPTPSVAADDGVATGPSASDAAASAAQPAAPMPPVQGSGVESRPAVAEAPIAVPPAPKNNLGVSEEWVEVVIPDAQTVLDDFVDDLKGLQISPNQARRLKEINLERGRQRATPYLDLPNVVTRSVGVDLSPGARPPEINLARGFQTSLVFTDGAGNPWPIEHVQMNRQLFSDGGNVMAGSVLSIEPQTAIAYGNVTIRLQDKNTPVVLLLNAGEKATVGQSVDVRVDVKIPGRSPGAPTGRVLDTSSSPDDTMLRFLDGNAPADAVVMRASGGAWMDAWRWRGHLYVRTKDVVMWPAYDAASRSGGDDGVYVYRFREDVDSHEVLGKDSFALTFRHGSYGDVRTVFFSPRVQRAIVGEDGNIGARNGR